MRKSIAVMALSIACLFAAQAAKAQDSCQSVAGNLVQNCGFETGDFSFWSGTALTDPLSFSGVDNTDPFSGNDEAFLGTEAGNDILVQSLNTVAGQTYTISFALDNDADFSPGFPNDFSAAFGSTALVSLGFPESDVAAGPYVVESFSDIATSSTTNLTFTFENELGFFDLDSVSVVATPEPSSLLLLGTGVLGFAGVVRRRLGR